MTIEVQYQFSDQEIERIAADFLQNVPTYAMAGWGESPSVTFPSQGFEFKVVYSEEDFGFDIISIELFIKGKKRNHNISTYLFNQIIEHHEC